MRLIGKKKAKNGDDGHQLANARRDKYKPVRVRESGGSRSTVRTPAPMIDRIPTAIGYESDDSGENFNEERSRFSRYQVEPDEVEKDASENKGLDDKYGNEGNADVGIERLWSDSTDSCPPEWRSWSQDEENAELNKKLDEEFRDTHDDKDGQDPIYDMLITSPRTSNKYSSKLAKENDHEKRGKEKSKASKTSNKPLKKSKTKGMVVPKKKKTQKSVGSSGELAMKKAVETSETEEFLEEVETILDDKEEKSSIEEEQRTVPKKKAKGSSKTSDKYMKDNMIARVVTDMEKNEEDLITRSKNSKESEQEKKTRLLHVFGRKKEQKKSISQKSITSQNSATPRTSLSATEKATMYGKSLMTEDSEDAAIVELQKKSPKAERPVELDEYSVLKEEEPTNEPHLVQCLRFYYCGAAAHLVAECKKPTVTTQPATDDARNEPTFPNPQVELILEENIEDEPESAGITAEEEKGTSKDVVEEAPDITLGKTHSFVREVTDFQLQLDEDSEEKRRSDAIQRAEDRALNECLSITTIEIPQIDTYGSSSPIQKKRGLPNFFGRFRKNKQSVK